MGQRQKVLEKVRSSQESRWWNGVFTICDE